MNWLRTAAYVFPFCCLLAAAQGATSASAPKVMTLERVVVLGRHGVRSPLQTAEKLSMYSHDAWPKWDVAPGELTQHGSAAMKTLGSFYANHYRTLLKAPGESCTIPGNAYIWTDTDSRDRSTAQAFVEGLAPGCSLPVHGLAPGQVDPVVHVLKAHLGHPNGALAAAEVLGRAGGDGDHVLSAYAHPLLTLDRVLGGCGISACPGETPGRTIVPALHANLQAADDDDHLLSESKGALGIASTLSEIMLLEYTDGKPMAQVGFGRLTRADLTEVLGLHSIYFDLAQETDYPARVQASNMAVHVLHALTDTRATTPSPQAAAATMFHPDGARFVYIAAHDTNIANMAGLLRAHWYMPNDAADATPPGGALVFELWHQASDGTDRVRVRVIAQTLDQLRENTPLIAPNGPAILPVWIPECSTDIATAACPLSAFQQLVEARVFPEFVTP